jgi:hypothetical protein
MLIVNKRQEGTLNPEECTGKCVNRASKAKRLENC